MTAESSSSRNSAFRGRLFAWIGVLALALAVVLSIRREPSAPDVVRLTGGSLQTSRALILRSFAAELARRGIAAEVLETSDRLDELGALGERRIDFALVSSAIELHRLHPELRAVTPFFDETLHLLVKREQQAAFASDGLEALRGLRVDIGPPGSAGAYLAQEVLSFAGIACAAKPDQDHCGTEEIGLHDLLARIDSGSRDSLPDAIFHLGSLPSAIALALIERADYGLIALPFADSFRLSALISDERHDDTGISAIVERRSTIGTVIPPFLYGTSPPNPPSPLPVLGAGLVLVTHKDVSPALVERVVETALETRFARVLDPRLDRAKLMRPSSVPLHAGAHAYLARERPLVAASDVDRLANALSVLGAVVGGLLFAWQSWRQRLRARRSALISGFQIEVAAIEHRITELELTAQLELEPLAELQRELLQLKRAALARFSAGELGDSTQIADLLSPLNAARDHVGSLLLHVREGLEEKARRQGRSAESVWEEAIEANETD